MQPADTMPVRAAHQFDVDRLEQWLRVNVRRYAGPLTVVQFQGGQSNPTYRLITPTRSYVLRRKPPGALVKGAHAVEREARVMQALSLMGFPVPAIVGLCTDDAVIGTWFYVMDMIEGRIFWDATFPGTGAERPRYFDAMNATLAVLHRIDYQAVGLGDFGRSGEYVQRQIARWTRQYLEDVQAGRNAHLDRLIEWLPANLPPDDETRIVHGDFRCDNMIFHPTEPRVIAVLDWELSTLGSPLADFAYHLMMYRLPPLGVAGLLGANLEALRIPSEEEYVAAYCRRTARESIPDLKFYLAYNLFRFAAIVHGIKARALRGTAASENSERLVSALPVFAETAWQVAQA